MCCLIVNLWCSELFSTVEGFWRFFLICFAACVYRMSIFDLSLCVDVHIFAMVFWTFSAVEGFCRFFTICFAACFYRISIFDLSLCVDVHVFACCFWKSCTLVESLWTTEVVSSSGDIISFSVIFLSNRFSIVDEPRYVILVTREVCAHRLNGLF